MELEKALEDRCVEKVKARGGLALKLVPLGLKGFPDRTVFMPEGIIFLCEFKRAVRPSKTGAAQQHKWRMMLHLLGFSVYRIDNDADFDAALNKELSNGKV